MIQRPTIRNFIQRHSIVIIDIFVLFNKNIIIIKRSASHLTTKYSPWKNKICRISWLGSNHPKCHLSRPSISSLISSPKSQSEQQSSSLHPTITQGQTHSSIIIRTHQLLLDELDRTSLTNPLFFITGEPIDLLEVEIRPDLQQGRVYWTLPDILMESPDDTCSHCQDADGIECSRRNIEGGCGEKIETVAVCSEIEICGDEWISFWRIRMGWCKKFLRNYDYSWRETSYKLSFYLFMIHYSLSILKNMDLFPETTTWPINYPAVAKLYDSHLSHPLELSLKLYSLTNPWVKKYF